MWPFTKELPTITCDAFAEELFESIRLWGLEFVKRIEQPLNEAHICIESEDIETFTQEVIIAHLWAASCALNQDRAVLDRLHNLYFQRHHDCGKTVEEKAARVEKARDTLLKRYETYYEAYCADRVMSQQKELYGADTIKGEYSLPNAMLQVLLPSYRPVCEPALAAHVLVHINAFIMSVFEHRKIFTVTD